MSCVGLSLLLRLSRYGTSFWLVFGVGLVAIADLGLLFWLVDRFRRRHPQPIVPTVFETPWMLGSYAYIALLFWTLSLTIPGLNLLIYLK